jgi:hypothetical protein
MPRAKMTAHRWNAKNAKNIVSSFMGKEKAGGIGPPAGF